MTMRLSCVLLLVGCIFLYPASRAEDVPYVIQVSVDGLGASYLQALIAGGELPNFQRLQQEGAWTLSARCDYDISVTLPNHVTMVTGRGVTGATGHGWSDNTTIYYPPDSATTIQANKGTYVSSVYDVAGAAGTTALVSGKIKLSLIDTSYDTPDRITWSSIPTVSDDTTSGARVTAYVSQMAATPFNYSLVHIVDPDKAGSWGSTTYNDAIKRADGYLGQLLSLIATNPTFTGKTALIVTSDHGGQNNSHSDATSYLNYDIPFFVWAPGVTGNTELYSLNAGVRTDPGAGRPSYGAVPQPIRNGDGANLALKLLGLGAIPNSTINATQELSVFGTGTAARRTIAYTAFNEVPIGVTSWSPGATDTELGFTTTISEGPTGSSYSLGTYDSSSSPRRFRMRGYTAEVAFDAVDLDGWRDVWAGVDVQIAGTTYEADDYFYVRLTDGIETNDLANAQGTALNSLIKDSFLHFSAQVPTNWTQVSFLIGSSTDSSTGAEIINFDHLFLEGSSAVPEPSTLALFSAGGLALWAARRRR
jgi:hypothetical protein